MTSQATTPSDQPATRPAPSLLKVNLGCGVIALPGWENYDKSPVQLLRKFPLLLKLLVALKVLTPGHIQTWPDSVQRKDLTKPLPLADGSVGAIYSSHMLEHVFLDDARKLVGECFRVLAPGGIVRFALPDGELWARQLVESSGDAAAGFHYNELAGQHYAVLMAGYSYQLASLFRRSAVAGATLEYGNAWENRGDMRLGDGIWNGSLYLGFDSWIGPMLFGYGRRAGGGAVLFLEIGKPW